MLTRPEPVLGPDRGRNASEAPVGVTEVKMITDRETGRPRGFGFVEMDNSEDASAAVAALNGFTMDGRPLTVNEARERGSGGGGGGGGDRY